MLINPVPHVRYRIFFVFILQVYIIMVNVGYEYHHIPYSK